MKRPILALLAAALLSVGVLAGAPAQAATPETTPSMATAGSAHDTGEDHGLKYSHLHRQGGTRWHHLDPRNDGDHDDGDGHGDGNGDGNGDGHGRRKQCEGLIAICLL